MLSQNIILDTDSYKLSHYRQYPPGTSEMYSYLESRGGRYAEVVFFGLQYQLKKYLSTPVTMEMLEEAEEVSKAHGCPFNREGWLHIIEKHDGFIPVRIKALPEGSVVATRNVLASVESTDPEVFWIASYIETLLMRIWYPITVATQSWHIRQMVLRYLEESCDHPEEEINFKLHDFGARGVSSDESAGIGGLSHLVNFFGSDTLIALRFAREYYDCNMAAFSIPASEHSTMTAWGREHETDAYANMLAQYGDSPLIACVSDSYDIYNAITNIWGKALKSQIEEMDATLVIRPDSGDPKTVVMECLKRAEEAFGVTRNSKNFKVLNSVRILQGDGVCEDHIREILEAMISAGYSAENIAFGMGGGLLQKVDRDTQKFAYKCSEVCVDGERRPVFKDPITDRKGKRSKKGRLSYCKRDGRYQTLSGEDQWGDLLQLVYENGRFFNETTLDQVRERALAAASNDECKARVRSE